jgi:hypothetical protein
MKSLNFLPILNVVKINDVCYQVNNFVETTCTCGGSGLIP